MTEPTQNSGGGYFAEDYQALFRRQWAPWTAGILIGLINVLMFAYAKPWGVAEGVQNWGNWMLVLFDAPVGDQAPPWLFTTSVTNLSFMFGAFVAALLSGQFVLRLTYRRDLIRSLLGGVLLGIGSVLGIGCTIGGFLSAFSALSLAGPLFMLGLFGGAWMGLKLLIWDLSHESARPAAPPAVVGSAWQKAQPSVGLALLIAAIVYFVWDGTEFTYAGITGLRSVLVFFALALGVVNQRSRFCFVRAFREPFMTGEGAMAKGGALALAIGVVGFSILKGTELSDYRAVGEFVNPSVWLGSLSGGLIFGTGMVLTGGCASGSLWRAGEGQLKFIAVLAVFALTNALFTLLLRTTEARSSWGDAAYFLPNMVGWGLGIVILLGIALAWALLAAWNEKSETLVVG